MLTILCGYASERHHCERVFTDRSLNVVPEVAYIYGWLGHSDKG
jgi:hypothetical protein